MQPSPLQHFVQQGQLSSNSSQSALNSGTVVSYRVHTLVGISPRISLASKRIVAAMMRSNH
eukprot:scaffold1605_cov141-Cylindrotheca_fusiformis.AAC.4